MSDEPLCHVLLRVASLLAPPDQRARWLEEWRSELWYIPRRGAALFCMGAFRDAIWLRRNNPSPAQGTFVHPDSPVTCLTRLCILAAVSILITVGLSIPLRLLPLYSHMKARDLLGGCLATLLFSCLLSPAILAVGQAPARRQAIPSRGRLRRGVFLALKIVLVQPILLSVLIVWILIAPFAPFAPYLLFAGCILALRWVFTDQRRRCPVCLRLLTNPVRIGTPSQTFLEWYGAESMCSRGHGLLQVSENSPSASGDQQWLYLDASWHGLFSAK